MNSPEAIAATYLRLNGFFLLTNFTVFEGGSHRDIDIVGVRAPGAAENVEGGSFLTDEDLLTKVADDEKWAAVVVQVKGGEDAEAFPKDEDVRYVMPMVGGSATRMTKIAFSNKRDGIVPTNEGIAIGLAYAIDWIWKRIDGMDERPSSRRLSKTGSWTWSDPTLETLLVLRRIQRQERKKGRQEE